MAFRLPRLPRAVALIDKDGKPLKIFQQWIQSFADKIETQENTQDELLAAVIAAQAAADAAAAAAAAADAAAATAQTAADDAQVTADAAAAAVAAIEVPPSGSRTVTGSGALLASDSVVLADASGGPMTLDLPLAAAASDYPISVVKTDASANAVTVAPDGSDQLNGGGGGLAINTQGERRTFSSDGTSDWYG